MRATEGMKGDGYYDAHGEYQRDVARTGAHLLEEAVRSVGSVPGGWTIVDYGCGTGVNSKSSFRTAIEAYRALDPTGTVVAVHADLPTNDWGTLFANMTDDTGGYRDLRGTILPTAVGTDFFGPCVAPGSAHIGMSFNAAHWLAALPPVHAPGALYFDRTTDETRSALATTAAADWRRFLAARASDLATDGRLLVQCVGSVPDDRVPGSGTRATASELLAVMNEVAEGLAAAGVLSQDVLDAYVFPVYARTVDEAVAPLQPGRELADSFAIEVAETNGVPSPYEALYLQDGDATAYAAAYVGFVRGFSESSLRIGLFEPGAVGISPQVLVDRFFTELAGRFEAEPGAHAFEDWTLTILLRRLP